MLGGLHSEALQFEAQTDQFEARTDHIPLQTLARVQICAYPLVVTLVFKALVV